MSAVKFFILTSAQYLAIDPKDDGTLYFVSDQNRIYKGTVPYSHPIELVDEFPATGLVGTLYVNTSTKEGKAWNGSAWVAEYDGASGKLTFTTNGGTPIEITLPVEQFLAAAAYDAEAHILSLTMTDNTKFDVDLGDLIDVYEAGETESISVAVSDGTISATLKVSSEAENQLQIRSDGAYVPPLSWQTVEGA